MSEELQPVEVSFDDDEPDQQDVETGEIEEAAETEDQETPDSASATDDTASEQAVKFDEKQQAKVNELIAEKVKRQREAERKAEKLERELNEIKARLPEHTRPVIPPVPDPFALSESEFKAALAAREEAIRRQAEFDAQQQSAKAAAENARAEAEKARVESTQQKVAAYSQRATALGVSPEELRAAGSVVGSIGLDDSLVDLILGDEKGPLITKYLANNVIELEVLRNMPTAMAAVRLATEIKGKISAQKPKVNPAPEPAPTLRNSGSARRQYGPKGATYE